MIAATAALALASCASLEKPFSPAPPPKPTASAPKPAPRPPAPSAAKPANPVPAPAPVTVTPAPPPPQAPVQAPRPPIRVIGLSEAEVEALLGPPAARATEGAGRTWRYGAGDCAVTLFFFLDVSRNAFYALDQKIAGPDEADSCLRRVADARSR